jgi:hypothetical protein
MDYSVSYCDYKSILVINPLGILKQVFTPFFVTSIDESNKGLRLIVDEVRTTQEDKLVYVINGKNYYHHLFVIEIKF